MLSKSKRKGSVRAEIPRQLYRAIIRIQADEDLEWKDAAIKAAFLIDQNRDKFKKAVRREANNLANSRLMTQLNKGRESIRDNAFKDGMNYIRLSEDNFRVPCINCGKNMHFTSGSEEWEDAKVVLYEAFENWRHTNCR